MRDLVKEKITKKKYYENNKTKQLAYDKEYRKANKDKISKREKEYYQNNKDKNNNRKAKRRALLKDALPKDISKDELKDIANIYKKCRELSILTGVEHHVDHIKPLSKGGIHHPKNLQILTAKANLIKGCKYEAGGPQ